MLPNSVYLKDWFDGTH